MLVESLPRNSISLSFVALDRSIKGVSDVPASIRDGKALPDYGS